MYDIIIVKIHTLGKGFLFSFSPRLLNFRSKKVKSKQLSTFNFRLSDEDERRISVILQQRYRFRQVLLLPVPQFCSSHPDSLQRNHRQP